MGTAIHHVRTRLPFPLLGLDSDNGSEFISQNLYTWCQREGITFTRSRSYKKNDSCLFEQKNGALVRKVIGYQRYDSKEALEMLNRIYSLLRLYTNFFQPSMKLTGKQRDGAKIYKTTLIVVLLLKYLQFRSKCNLPLCCLGALLRLNLFSYRNLWDWLDDPFETPTELPNSHLELAI